MAEARPRAGYLLPAAIIVAVILYGSLYPFEFRQPCTGLGPLRTLLDSWAQTPRRGDFAANILFYMPLGFFVSLASGRRGLPGDRDRNTLRSPAQQRRWSWLSIMSPSG